MIKFKRLYFNIYNCNIVMNVDIKEHVDNCNTFLNVDINDHVDNCNGLFREIKFHH